MICFLHYNQGTEPDVVTMQISVPGWMSLVDLTEHEVRTLRESITNVLMDWEPEIPRMKYADLGSVGYADLPDPDDDIPF